MAPTAGARSRGRPHPDLLGRGDRRLEWRGSDVELAAVMVTEPKHPVHGVGAGALRRRTNREDDAAVLNRTGDRSEEHTSELQSRLHLVCRLLLEKKKNKEENKN